jgi:hypothetical protein
MSRDDLVRDALAAPASPTVEVIAEKSKVAPLRESELRLGYGCGFQGAASSGCNEHMPGKSASAPELEARNCIPRPTTHAGWGSCPPRTRSSTSLTGRMAWSVRSRAGYDGGSPAEWRRAFRSRIGTSSAAARRRTRSRPGRERPVSRNDTWRGDVPAYSARSSCKTPERRRKFRTGWPNGLRTC